MQDLSFDIKKLAGLYSEQESIIKHKQQVLNQYRIQIEKLKKDSFDLNSEASKISNIENLTLFHYSSDSDEEDSPEFIPVENIFNREIASLKQEKKLLKKHISQLLRLLGRDPEENEEYSSGE